MKSKISFVTYLVLLFAFVSCNSRDNPESQNGGLPKTIHLNLSETSTDSVNLSFIADKIEYILLQTTDSSMISYIYSFSITKDYYFLEEEGCVLVFDNKGRYVKRLYQKGHGPGETSTRSFTVDESGELVYVLDIYNGDVKVYDFHGKFIKNINKPISTPDQRTASIGYWDNKLIVTTAQSPKVKFLYTLFGLSDYSIHELYKNHYIYDKSQVNQRPSIIYWIDRCYQVVDSNLIFKEWFCDTIFNVYKNLKTEPKYIIDLGNKKLDWLSWRDHGMFNLLLGPPSGYWVESFTETNSFLVVSLKSFKEQTLLAIFEKENNSVKILANKYYKPRTNNQVYLRNDIDRLISFPVVSKNGNIFYYDGCLYSVIEAKEFTEAYRKAPEKTKNATRYLRNMSPVFREINEFSNPVIVKAYLK